ncbi:GH32 C-terminal domain-containing protein [Pontibacter sp. CAU 1760]
MDAAAQAYQEPYRLQYHFSPKENWINDPCGMVYLDGEYHLMYQYNPFGTQWGSMSWGHAVSKDLVHWEELPVALFPDAQGQIFSGGAVIDHQNTAGFGDSAMVAIYTSAGTTQKQNIGYSLNKGRTWKKYAGNPVLQNQGVADFRDPQVFWHEETDRWIMTLAVMDRIEIYSSPNLKDWTYQSDFGSTVGAHGGVWECPDLFQLKVEGQSEPLWVMMVSINPGAPSGGSGTQYFLGNFNGSTFTLTDEFSALVNEEKVLPQGVLFEGFEGNTFAGWRIEGTAFGTKPAAGALPDQQQVAGYLGSQLANSYMNGDASQGKLKSSSFTIQHDFINFLIGGGNHPGKAEIRLIINGEVVAATTGQNEEKLRWKFWDVKEFEGLQASIEVVDEVTEGWGHINIDHIYFADEAIIDNTVSALWTDYGPDFYAGRSWDNQPTDTYERVWLAWMNNWAYAGALPTSTWCGSMSLPRSLQLRHNREGEVRLYQNPVNELNELRAAETPVSFTNLRVKELNQQIAANKVTGTSYEVQFTLVPGTTSTKTGLLVRKGESEQTEIGYDPSLNAIYIDRSQSGASFSGDLTKVFYAPLETEQQELKFRIYVDASSVEVFVNDGALVQTAHIFPSSQSDKLAFFGSDEVLVKAMDFWKMKSIWQAEPVLSSGEELLAQSIMVYPNPSKGQFRVRSKQAIAAIELFDVTGKQVGVKSFYQEAGITTVVASENQRPGLKFLRIYLKGGKTLVKKVITE